MIRFVDEENGTLPESRKKELLKYNGKYFIELEDHHYNGSLAELSMSMASEIELLRKRIFYLEEKLSKYEEDESTCIIRKLPRD